MKEGWEVKKLGDVCEIKSGKSIQASYIKEDDGISPYKCYGGNGIRGYVDSYTHEGVYPIIGRVGALCGNIHLANGKFNATEHALIVDIKDEDVNVYWMVYNLKHLDLRKIAKGVAQPVISAGEVMKVYINVPTLKEQSRIVEELDQLSNIIEKKRQQLSELDNLAQSIFYDMFGDPVTNEKGWEVKKLGDIAYIGLGFTHTPEYVDEGIPFLSVKDITKGEICWDKIKFVSKKEYESAPRGAKPNKGDILFCRVGTMGKPVIIKTDKPFCTFVSLGYLHLLNNEIVNVYVKYWMLSYAFDIQVEANVKGLAIKNLNTGWLKTFNIQIPPLQLQQLFAQKIEAIEKEKELIKQSIKETEELFNSRMDYYFG